MENDSNISANSNEAGRPVGNGRMSIDEWIDINPDGARSSASVLSEYRSGIFLRRLEGESPLQIAQSMGEKPRHIRDEIHRARKIIAEDNGLSLSSEYLDSRRAKAEELVRGIAHGSRASALELTLFWPRTIMRYGGTLAEGEQFSDLIEHAVAKMLATVSDQKMSGLEQIGYWVDRSMQTMRVRHPELRSFSAKREEKQDLAPEDMLDKWMREHPVQAETQINRLPKDQALTLRAAATGFYDNEQIREMTRRKSLNAVQVALSTARNSLTKAIGISIPDGYMPAFRFSNRGIYRGTINAAIHRGEIDQAVCLNGHYYLSESAFADFARKFNLKHNRNPQTVVPEQDAEQETFLVEAEDMQIGGYQSSQGEKSGEVAFALNNENSSLISTEDEIDNVDVPNWRRIQEHADFENIPRGAIHAAKNTEDARHAEAWDLIFENAFPQIWEHVYLALESREQAETVVDLIAVRIGNELKNYENRNGQLFAAWIFKIVDSEITKQRGEVGRLSKIRNLLKRETGKS
ncbi:MAG TPA: hypothetical protein VG965_04740 [Patescibacteria group bacterium]|nr:hypothetical protein [Patescibacteria group bacterium]